MERRRIIDANRGPRAVPVLRYFLVMGCCLLGLLFAADYLLPKEAAPAPVEAATVSNGGSLASWRQSQEKLDKPQVSAVVYPDIAPLPPTAERLQLERQMTYRKPDSPALCRRGPSCPPRLLRQLLPAPPAKHAAKIRRVREPWRAPTATSGRITPPPILRPRCRSSAATGRPSLTGPAAAVLQFPDVLMLRGAVHALRVVTHISAT